MKIQNFEKLATTNLRRDALSITEAGLDAIDTQKIISENIKIENNNLRIKNEITHLSLIKNIYVVGVGKCSSVASMTLAKIFGNRFTNGIVLDVSRPPLEINPPAGGLKLEIFTGTHPLPSEQNIRATRKIIDFLLGLKENDLVIFVISGGGSALLAQPLNFSAKEECALESQLMKAGAEIHEMNTVRKHLSLARGGWLAKYAYPAQGIALIFSDVVGNDPEFISSGPTIKDVTSNADAVKIVKKYGIKNTEFWKSKFIETPKEEKYFTRIKNTLFVSNKTALSAMESKARDLGFNAQIITDRLSGEARDVGEKIAKDIKNAPAKTALLYGGETIVTVKHPGKGGRNQELALSALRFIERNQVIIPIASDGRDNTDFAGAICDTVTKQKAKEKNLGIQKNLDENHSYRFFAETESYLMTGDTNSNVSDLIIAVKGYYH